MQSKLFGGSFKKQAIPQAVGKSKSPQRRGETDDDFFNSMVRDPANGSRESFNVERSASPKKAALHAPMEKRLFDGLQSRFSGQGKTP